MFDALVILTGGKSSRMGTDKALLPFGDLTVIENLVSRFSPYFKQIYLSVSQKGLYNHINLSRFCDNEIIEIEDIYKDCGCIGGIYSTLCKVNADNIFVISVDMPFVTPETAIGIMEHGKDYEISLLKRENGYIEPAFAKYSRCLVPLMNELILEKKYALKHIIEKAKTKFIDEKSLHMYEPVSFDHIFFNMNTKEKYYEALSIKLRQPSLSPNSKIPVLSFVASSGTGKTTYLEKLLPYLKNKGLRIAVIKHDAHDFEMDNPQKDSYRLRKAGADIMYITSPNRTAFIAEHNDIGMPLDSIISQIKNVDLIITEGFKNSDKPKIEIYRQGVSRNLTFYNSSLMAVVSDTDLDKNVPLFKSTDFISVTNFIVNFMANKSNS